MDIPTSKTQPRPPKDLYRSDKSKHAFHTKVHGGDYACIGIYDSPEVTVRDANHRTVSLMASMVDLSPSTHVLDLGSGYGGAARYLASTFGCSVTCLNVNRMQNAENRRRNQEDGLSGLITVLEGSYDRIRESVDGSTFDLAWSQDAMLFSQDRRAIFDGVAYALRGDGGFIFTDLMRRDDCPPEALAQLLSIQGIPSLSSPEAYIELGREGGFEPAARLDMPEHLYNHYTRVAQSIEAQRDALEAISDLAFIEGNLKRINTWAKGAKEGHFTWGILHLTRT